MEKRLEEVPAAAAQYQRSMIVQRDIHLVNHTVSASYWRSHILQRPYSALLHSAVLRVWKREGPWAVQTFPGAVWQHKHPKGSLSHPSRAFPQEIFTSPQNCKNKDIHRSIIYNTKKNPVNSPQVHEKGCFHKLWENYMIEYCYHFNYLICMFFVKKYIFWLCVFMWNTYNFSGKMSCEKFWFQKTDYTCLKTLYVDIWSACICVAETNYGSLWVHTCQEAPFPFLANLSTLTF